MTTTTHYQPEQSEQDQDKKPMFSHRFDQTKAHDIGEVTDAIGLMTDKARGILYMLFAHSSSGTQYTNEIVQMAISAAISEIDDIDDVLHTHWDAIHPDKSSVGGGAV
jgi:hypothetical protein